MKFVLNLDYYDMLVCGSMAGTRFIGCREGHYPEEDLVGLIHRAADCGFSSLNFRIAVCGLAAFPSRVKEPAANIPEWTETFRRYNPFETAVRAAREAGIACYAWLTPLDDSGPMEGKTPAGLQSRFFPRASRISTALARRRRSALGRLLFWISGSKGVFFAAR